MITHETIHAALSGVGLVDPSRPTELGLTQVARYRDERLELPGGRALIFLPDMHLLAGPDAARFSHNHFVLKELLLEFLRKLRDLKVAFPGELSVIHLGDLFDLWRCRGGMSTDMDVASIAAEFEEILSLLRNSPPVGTRAIIVAGNHDYELHNVAGWVAPRFLIVENNNRAAGDILILHGDSFDWLERLPDPISSAVVRLAKWVKAGQHLLESGDAEASASVNRDLPEGDHPLGAAQADLRASVGAEETAERFNVVSATSPNVSAGSKRFYPQASKLVSQLRKKHGHNIRTVVIGHTHWGRIVVGDQGTEPPFVLMDCGAWIGQCRFTTTEPWQYSAQLGVIVGNDLRVYQVGFSPVS